MAKRFTDTEIWDKEWFMQLSLKHKCLIRYLFDKCDAAGIWQPNWHLASTYVGEKVSAADLPVFKKHIELLPDGKIFVVDFIQFQYGVLTETCAPHRKIIAMLKKSGLYERVLKGYHKGINTHKEEDKEKEEEKEVDKEKDKGGMGGFEVTLKIDIPENVLEAAELSQYTLTKQKNTDFIKSQWKVFLSERMNDPPAKKHSRMSEVTSHFLNWVRNKHPKINGNHTGNTSKKPIPTGEVGKGGFGNF
jgi:hypothetical protein